MGDIYLYSDIEQGSAAEIVASLDNAGGSDVILYVNCYGGDVFEGKTIMHRLRDYSGSVTAVVEGVAASAASFIIVGGADRIVMREGSRMMVHNALTMAVGNANDLGKLSAELRGQSEDIARIYAERSGSNVDEWLEVMDKETWFTAEQAVSAGLADAVEHGKAEPVLAAARSRVMNLFKGHRSDPPESLLTHRAAAPPPPSASRSESAADTHIHPQGEERSDGMSLTKEDIVALIRDEVKSIRNESVQISGEVDVNYPTDVKIVPTEKIKVEPVIGDKPAEPVEGEQVEEPVDDADEPAGDSAAVQLAKQAGLTFAMGDIAEGFTAEVDEGGVVTITAPSGAEVGSTAAFTVLVNDTPVALSVTVRSLSEDTEDEPTEEAPEAVEPAPEAAPDAPVNKIVLDADSYNELKAAAQFGWSAMESQKEKDLEAEVDQWIAEGRISSALRTKAVTAIKRDAVTARDLYGTNPKNTIPRAEVGYGRQSADDVDPDAAERRSKPNPFPKPKF